MAKRKIWIGAAAVLGVLLFILANSFKSETIQILIQTRPSRNRTAEFSPISFAFTERQRLKQVKVVSAEDLKTNKYAHAYWHMIAEGKVRSIKGFFYGDDEALKQVGLKPKIPNLSPEPLEPGKEYVLIVEADGATGQTNFTARPSVAMPSKK